MIGLDGIAVINIVASSSTLDPPRSSYDLNRPTPLKRISLGEKDCKLG